MTYHLGYRLGKRRGGHYLTRENYIDVSTRNSLGPKPDSIFLRRLDKYTIPKEWLIWYLQNTIKYMEENENYKTNFAYGIDYHKSVLNDLLNERESEREISQKKLWELIGTRSTFEGFLETQLSLFNQRTFNIDFEKDITGKTYTESWIEEYKEKALENFDLNMIFLERLSERKFNRNLKKFLRKNKQFKEVNDLTKYTNKPGNYLMVADKYKQVYIGTSFNIGKRIRNHWNNRKPLDRLLFPMNDIENSKISFDSYRALDITRVYIYITESTFVKEDNFIEDFNDVFVGNRLSGGIKDNLFEVIAGIKTRNLNNK